LNLILVMLILYGRKTLDVLSHVTSKLDAHFVF